MKFQIENTIFAVFYQKNTMINANTTSKVQTNLGT